MSIDIEVALLLELIIYRAGVLRNHSIRSQYVHTSHWLRNKLSQLFVVVSMFFCY